jgi:hypothetical protein
MNAFDFKKFKLFFCFPFLCFFALCLFLNTNLRGQDFKTESQNKTAGKSDPEFFDPYDQSDLPEVWIDPPPKIKREDDKSPLVTFLTDAPFLTNADDTT